MNSQLRYPLFIRLQLPLLMLSIILLCAVSSKGQENPPKPISVYVKTEIKAAQPLNFGTIIPTSDAGGTVEVYHDNSTAKSGDVLQLHNSQCTAALFFVDSEPGVLIRISYPDNNIFELSNGSYHMKFKLTLPYIDNRPTYEFVTRSTTTYVYIGGVLTVGSINANPSGSYTGTFLVTFDQQ